MKSATYIVKQFRNLVVMLYHTLCLQKQTYLLALCNGESRPPSYSPHPQLLGFASEKSAPFPLCLHFLSSLPVSPPVLTHPPPSPRPSLHTLTWPLLFVISLTAAV